MKFCVVTGPGRSGTSLAMKLVEACGFSLGKCLPPNKRESLRHGYGEHPVTNTADPEGIRKAIQQLESEGCNAIKLIHLYRPWIKELKTCGYDVRVVVTSRPEREIWESGMDIYPGWQPNAISAICGTAKRILSETRKYLTDPDTKAYELPFHKVVAKDETTLIGLSDFLTDSDQVITIQKMKDIIRPDIVRHAKVNNE